MRDRAGLLRGHGDIRGSNGLPPSGRSSPDIRSRYDGSTGTHHSYQVTHPRAVKELFGMEVLAPDVIRGHEEPTFLYSGAFASPSAARTEFNRKRILLPSTDMRS